MVNIIATNHVTHVQRHILTLVTSPFIRSYKTIFTITATIDLQSNNFCLNISPLSAIKITIKIFTFTFTWLLFTSSVRCLAKMFTFRDPSFFPLLMSGSRGSGAIVNLYSKCCVSTVYSSKWRLVCVNVYWVTLSIEKCWCEPLCR